MIPSRPNARGEAKPRPSAAPPLPTIDDLAEAVGTVPLVHRPRVTVFQNFYDDSVRDMIDPDFTAVDGRRNANTGFRENGLFLRMYASGLYRAAAYTGIVSPKFRDKTGLTGRRFLAFIQDHPGCDVYFVNPFPQNTYYNFNVWDQGELCHPGILALAELLYRAAGFPTDCLHQPRHSPATALYSSFWVGNARFWEAYLDFLTRLVDALEALPERLRDHFLRPTDYIFSNVPMLPFIFERSFSTFLTLRPDLRPCAYPYRKEEVFARVSEADVEGMVIRSFFDWVTEADASREYTPSVREVFRAMGRLVRRAAG